MSENPDKVRMHLPVENWLDIFAHIPRQQLANQVATVNWKFAAIVQLWLDDKCGKVTMQRLYLTESLRNHPTRPPFTVLYDKSKEIVPFPSSDVPMPSNIVDFEGLVFMYRGRPAGRISCGSRVRQKNYWKIVHPPTDDRMMGMLDQMGPLLSNVNIYCSGLFGYHRMRRLMPYLRSIKSVRVFENKKERMWPDDWPQCLANVSTIISPLPSFGCVQGGLLDWLLKRGEFAGEGDGSEPRALIAYMLTMQSDIAAIFKQFEDAESPSTFFIRINRDLDTNNREVRNIRTGEILRMKIIYKFALISRHPIGADTEEWVAKKEKELIGWKWKEQKRRIVIRHGYIGKL